MEINEVLTDIERGFNITGGLPVASVYTSALREIAAEVQFVAGAVLTLTGIFCRLIGIENRKWEHLSFCGIEQMIHGCFNTARAALEATLAATGVGSLFLLGVQFISKNGFYPIIAYEKPAKIIS